MRIGNYRAQFIDYRKPGIFMITMNKAHGIPVFSKIICKAQIPSDSAFAPESSNGAARVATSLIATDYTKMGFGIYEALQQLGYIWPHIKKHQYVIMPDHLHLLLEITQTLEEPLGFYMGEFKKYVWQRARIRELITEDTPCIFERGFNDQFLRGKRSLDTLYNYIRKNPYNLWIRRFRPDFFQKIQKAEICGVECSLYGNISLLSNPFISPVVIHRKDTEQIREQKKQFWRYRTANGGVLASAFIAPSENEIFKATAAYGGKIILITHIPLAEREKPKGQLFSLCENGQLLIISPKIPEGRREARPTRSECLYMNAFAEKLSLRGGSAFSGCRRPSLAADGGRLPF